LKALLVHHSEDGDHDAREVGRGRIPVNVEDLITCADDTAARETADTYAYNLSEIKTMLAALKEPAWTVILTAALTGLCKAEIRGLYWEDFDGKQLSVKRSVWNSVVSEPKTKRRKAEGSGSGRKSAGRGPGSAPPPHG
jgi:integrase